MIQLKNVSVRYENEKEAALKNVNLTINRGEFVAVLGRSGAGKSTFIRTINGLQPPTTGDVYIDGKVINRLDEKELREVRSKIGMIFQHFHLIPRLTVRQNILTGRFGKKPAMKSLLGIFTDEEMVALQGYLDKVGLSQFANRRVEQLSGGQKQRVGIARALMQEPEIFLGDEPVASLDPATATSIFDLIRTIHDENKLVTIINVHGITLAKKYATRIIGLYNGEVIFDGAPHTFNEKEYAEIYKNE